MNEGYQDPGDSPRRPSLPPAFRLVALECVGSTNDEARRLVADADAEDGTLVWAREQTGGRGRLGRDWNSPRGNLYLSLILRPECPLSEAVQLGFVAAIALCDAIGTVMPPMAEAQVKWPNDILVNDCKIAGFLLETVLSSDGSMQALLLGMGVNVRHYPEDARYPATSLRAAGAASDVDEVAVLEAFSRHFLKWTNRWLDEGFSPVRANWLHRAKGRGERIEVRLPNETLHGVFRDLDEAGALCLDREDGGDLRRIYAGDVFFAE